MALGNWISSTWSEKGKPIEGVFLSRLGVRVHVYKNWLYIEDKKAWNGGEYTKPTIMQVWSGSLTYKDVHIVATRGPRHGIYFVVWSEPYVKGRFLAPKVMLGISQYAFSGNREVPIGQKENARLLFLLRKWIDLQDGHHFVPESLKKIVLKQNEGLNQGMSFMFRALSKGYVGEKVKKAFPVSSLYKAHKA